MEHQLESNKENHAAHAVSNMQLRAIRAMGMGVHIHYSFMIADFTNRSYIVLIPSISIMLLSTMTQKLVGAIWHFPGASYILFALPTIVYLYGGFPLLKEWLTK